jgi:hypothetical protein
MCRQITWDRGSSGPQSMGRATSVLVWRGLLPFAHTVCKCTMHCVLQALRLSATELDWEIPIGMME